MPRIDQYLKIAAAAEYLGVSANTLRKWADDEKIETYVNPANQYRLFRQDDLDRFLSRVAQTTRCVGIAGQGARGDCTRLHVNYDY